jgi:hypothetical protein
MHHKTPFSHNGFMKIEIEYYENIITKNCINSEPCMTYYPKCEITIYFKLQLSNSSILSRALLRMHSNVMLRFLVQALQDPPLCSSINFSSLWTISFKNKVPCHNMRSQPARPRASSRSFSIVFRDPNRREYRPNSEGSAALFLNIAWNRGETILWQYSIWLVT